jgi:hypothetical protein
MRRGHIAVVAAAGALAVLTAVPAHAAEYSSALKIKGVQYDARAGTPTAAPPATPTRST